MMSHKNVENYAITRDFWGINKKQKQKLNKKGIVTVGDLAQYPYRFLKRDFWCIRDRYAFTC